MKSGISPRLARRLSISAAKVATAKTEMRATPQARKYRSEQEALVAIIQNAMNSAKRVEDLIQLEMTLQEMDRDQAFTEQEQGSIDKAQTAYREIVHTVEQMRRSPEEYIRANLSITSQNIAKMPDVRGPMKIRGNLARLQNRAMFAPEEDRQVWDARVSLANRTEGMLKELHKTLIAECEKKD